LQTLHNWTAKRAGGRITITGRTVAGAVIKIVGVDMIAAASPYPVATDKDGRRYHLA